jgi:hypothetical protein
VHVTGAGDDASVATSKTGQVVEIRTLMEPASTPAGGDTDITLRVYINGDAASVPTAFSALSIRRAPPIRP